VATVLKIFLKIDRPNLTSLLKMLLHMG